MPEKGSAYDVNHIQAALSKAAAWHGQYVAAEDGTNKVGHMCSIYFAEVAKVVRAQQMVCSLLHGCYIQGSILDDVILVFSVQCGEPRAYA